MPDIAPVPAIPMPDTAVLGVTDVTKVFHRGPPWHHRRVDVLRGASRQVDAGELVGLLGENGSGKSTLMQIIVVLLGRDSGEIVSKPPEPPKIPTGFWINAPELEEAAAQ